MKEYTVRVNLDAFMDVQATDPDSALTKANDYITNYDFGRLKNIDWETILLGKSLMNREAE